MTWGQIWQSMKNTAMIAFQPVLQRLNDIANSEVFQTFVNGAIEAMATLANVVLNIFELIGTVGGFIADNWSIISPIIYGVIGALAVYAAYLGIVKGIELASAAASAVMAVGKGLYAAATMIATGATWAQNNCTVRFEWCNVCVSYRLDNHAYYCPDCNNFCSMFSYCQTDRCCKFRVRCNYWRYQCCDSVLQEFGSYRCKYRPWYW